MASDYIFRKASFGGFNRDDVINYINQSKLNEEKLNLLIIEKENEIIKSCDFENSVVATGGSAVYGKEAMERLSENGTVVYLSIPVEELQRRISNIHTRGVAMKKGTTLYDLFEERRPLYEGYADITVECMGLTAEECVEKIAEELGFGK